MLSWMTIMSVDLCWTFRQAQVPRRSSAVLKFLLYSLVGWGSSALLTLAIILIDSLNLFHSMEFVKPGVGEGKCFLQDQAVGVYLHLPSMVVMLLNAVLFLITTATIYRYCHDSMGEKYRKVQNNYINCGLLDYWG